jgi:hypothetical protein
MPLALKFYPIVPIISVTFHHLWKKIKLG